MQRSIAVIVMVLGLGATACKGKKASEGAGNANVAGSASTAASGSAVAKPAEAAGPALVIDPSAWVEKDLATVVPTVRVTMRIPKNAELLANSDGGVEVRVTDFYHLTISPVAAKTVADAISGDKRFTVDRADYQSTKLLAEEPSGYVYWVHAKDDAMGRKFEPEVHFAHYVEKGGAVYSIIDLRPMDSYATPGSVYSEQVARQVYEIVKASAKVN
jgi:hypothetical protein